MTYIVWIMLGELLLLSVVASVGTLVAARRRQRRLLAAVEGLLEHGRDDEKRRLEDLRDRCGERLHLDPSGAEQLAQAIVGGERRCAAALAHCLLQQDSSAWNQLADAIGSVADAQLAVIAEVAAARLQAGGVVSAPAGTRVEFADHRLQQAEDGETAPAAAEPVREDLLAALLDGELEAAAMERVAGADPATAEPGSAEAGPGTEITGTEPVESGEAEPEAGAPEGTEAASPEDETGSSAAAAVEESPRSGGKHRRLPENPLYGMAPADVGLSQDLDLDAPAPAPGASPGGEPIAAAEASPDVAAVADHSALSELEAALEHLPLDPADEPQAAAPVPDSGLASGTPVKERGKRRGSTKRRKKQSESGAAENAGDEA